MAWDDNPRRNRFGKSRARKPKRPRGRMTYAQHAAQGKQRRRGGNGKVYYGARGQAGLHRKNRKRKWTSTDNAVKYPHLYKKKSSKGPRASGKGYKSKAKTTSPYTPPKVTPPKASPPKPPKPPVPQRVRSNAWYSVFERYQVRSLFEQDSGIPGVLPQYPSDGEDNRDPGGEYGDYFDAENPVTPIALDIGMTEAQLSALIVAGAVEVYREDGTAYYETTFDLLPDSSEFSQIDIRIRKVIP
jgi:hypothetical protein